MLHWYRKGHGFKSRTGLNFFQVLFTTTRFSSVLSCEDLLISNKYTSTHYTLTSVCIFSTLFSIPLQGAYQGRICLTIKSFFRWWLFALLLPFWNHLWSLKPDWLLTALISSQITLFYTPNCIFFPANETALLNTTTNQISMPA